MVGDRIKSRRIELNMSQQELADLAGYKSRSTINKLELSDNITARNIERLSAALRTTPEYLMGWSNIKPVDDKTVLTKQQRELLKVTEGMTKSQMEKVVSYAEFVKGGE